jgi:predicted phage tail protein
MGFGKSILLLGQMLNISRAKAIAELSAASALTLGLSTIGIIAGIAAGAAAINSITKANDLYSGYGKRVLLAPEGAFAFNDKDNIIATTNPIPANDKDNIIATTNPIPANDLISRPAGSVRVSQQPSQPQQNIKVTPSTTVVQLNMDSANVGNAMARSNYRISSNIKQFGGTGIDASATV